MNPFLLIAPLFLIILLGYILKKTDFLNENFNTKLNSLIYYITLPLLLFKITSQLNITDMQDQSLYIGYPLTVILIFIVSILISFLLKKENRASFIQASFRSNLAYLGLPIALTVLDNNTSGFIAVIIATGAITNTILAVILFTFKNKTKNYTKAITLNPIVLAIVAGMLISLLQIKLPAILQSTIDLFSRMSLPSVLLLIGSSLTFKNIRKFIFTDILSASIKLLLMPLIAYFVFSKLSNNSNIINAGIVLAAMPTAMISFSFAKEYKDNHQLTSSIINFNTLLSLAVIPILVILLNGCSSNQIISQNSETFINNQNQNIYFGTNFYKSKFEKKSSTITYTFVLPKTFNKQKPTVQDIVNSIYFSGDILAYSFVTPQKIETIEAYYLTATNYNYISNDFFTMSKNNFLQKHTSTSHKMERDEIYNNGTLISGFSLVGSILENKYKYIINKKYKKNPIQQKQSIIYLAYSHENKIFIQNIAYQVTLILSNK